MPFRHDDTNDELDDREFPDDEGNHDAEVEACTETVPCTFCRREVAENAEWCPHCRNYLFYDDTLTRDKPWWLVGGVVACLLVVLYWILSG